MITGEIIVIFIYVIIATLVGYIWGNLNGFDEGLKKGWEEAKKFLIKTNQTYKISF